MNELATIRFHGDQLMAVQENGQIFVAVKPVSDRLGLAWHSQFMRIKRHKIMAEGILMMRIPSAGGEQETMALPLDLFCGWLVQIDINRVNVESQPIIERYQREAFRAIAAHFSQKKDSAYRKLEDQAYKFQRGYFERFPARQIIRELAMRCEPNFYIARMARCSSGTVGRAIKDMLRLGLMDAQALKIARIGIIHMCRLRRREERQYTFGF